MRTILVLLLVTAVAATAGCTNDQIAQFHAAAPAPGSGQQTFSMAMSMVNQTQIGNLNTTDYKPIQRSDGVWVYCVRTSSYTVNCRSQ